MIFLISPGGRKSYGYLRQVVGIAPGQRSITDFLRTYGIHRSTRSLPDVRGRIRICKPWPGSRTAWLGCRSRNPGLCTPERKVGIAHPRLRMRTNNVPRSYESRSYVLLQWEYRPHASAGYHTRLPHHNVQPLSGGSPLRLDSGWVSPFDR